MECFPLSANKSLKEKEIKDWLTTLDIDFLESNRSVLDNKELDIYIPNKNIAIEYNGLYWHSELFKDITYHLNKSLLCQEKNIQLLHIWEDEWIFKQDIIKSIIKNKLNIDNKIYLIDYDIRIIKDIKIVQDFLNNNHINGYKESDINIALYSNNHLLSMMCFSYDDKNNFELIRFCNIINTDIIESSFKLFNYFKNNFKYNKIIYYSDFRICDGRLYENLGFIKNELLPPNYFWCKNNERYDSTHNLISENKTDDNLILDNGYYRLYDSGYYKYIYE